MMREIKFRAWDGIKKRMVDMSQPASVENGITYEGYYHLLGGRGFNFPVMQYTGLKDESGKEIYEGDLRQWNFEGIERIYEVYYDDFHAAFKCKLVKYSDKYDPALDEFEQDFHKRMIREGACSHIIRDRWSKLIGNIYENPELIKEGKE